MNKPPKQPKTHELCSALSDMASLADAMTFAHGDNQMAQAIKGKHAATIDAARRWSLARCPVCEASACEVKSQECGT